MSLADQITQIRKLAAQGKTESEIAATVGVEIGDVGSVLDGGMATTIPAETVSDPNALVLEGVPQAGQVAQFTGSGATVQPADAPTVGTPTPTPGQFAQFDSSGQLVGADAPGSPAPDFISCVLGGPVTLPANNFPTTAPLWSESDIKGSSIGLSDDQTYFACDATLVLVVALLLCTNDNALADTRTFFHANVQAQNAEVGGQTLPGLLIPVVNDPSKTRWEARGTSLIAFGPGGGQLSLAPRLDSNNAPSESVTGGSIVIVKLA